MDKKVSILLPLYNCEKFIIKAIESVKAQTHKNWQLIIVDDRSTDNSYKIVKEYLEKNNDDRIILKQNTKNIGCYSSLNEALLVADGDYITCLGSDDSFKPTKLEKQVNYLETNLNRMAVICLFIREGSYPDNGDVTLMFRKQVVTDIGYFDSVRFGADSEYFWRIIKKYRNSIGKISECLYVAKKRPNSLTTNKDTGNISIRRNYIHKYSCWHNNAAAKKKLFVPYPLLERHFPIPAIMQP